MFEASSDFCPGGQEQQIRQGDAIHGGDEGDGDAVAHTLDIFEMLHDLNEPEHGADDADGGGVAAGGFEDFRFGLTAARGGLDFQFHDAAQILQIGTVDGQRESFLEERIIGDGVGGFFERDDAGAARLAGEVEQLRG